MMGSHYRCKYCGELIHIHANYDDDKIECPNCKAELILNVEDIVA